MLGSILALGAKDGDRMLDLQAFSRPDQAIQVLFHLFLGQQNFFFLYEV